MTAVREHPDTVQQFADLFPIVGMAEDRQAECGLGHEHVAGDRLKRRAGRIPTTLVVAGHHDAAAFVLQQNLRTAQHVAGRIQGHRNIAYLQYFAWGKRLFRLLRLRPISHRHDRQRLRGGSDGCVSRARVVGMTMGDHGAVDGAGRIDVEIAGPDIEPGRTNLDPAFRLR